MLHAEVMDCELSFARKMSLQTLPNTIQYIHYSKYMLAHL